MGLGTAASRVFRTAGQPPLHLPQSLAAFGTAPTTWDETPLHSQTEGTGRAPHVHPECSGAPGIPGGGCPLERDCGVTRTRSRDTPLRPKSGCGKEGVSRTPSRSAPRKRPLSRVLCSVARPCWPPEKEHKRQRHVSLARSRRGPLCCGSRNIVGKEKKLQLKTDLCRANCRKPCPDSQTPRRFLAFRYAQEGEKGGSRACDPSHPFLKKVNPNMSRARSRSPAQT